MAWGGSRLAPKAVSDTLRDPTRAFPAIYPNGTTMALGWPDICTPAPQTTQFLGEGADVDAPKRQRTRATRPTVVADLRRPSPTHLPHGGRREGVLQVEVLPLIPVQRLRHELHLGVTQRGGRKRLRLAAREQRRSVRARQQPALHRNWPYLRMGSRGQ